MPTIYTPSSIPLRIPFAPNRGFNFAKPIRVTNRTTKLTDYQIEVDLDTDNFAFEKARSDGADMRFQDANGKSLSYWIESWTASSAKIWMKLDEIEDYEDRIIWLIYGNFDTKSESSGTSTFAFFDDFEEGSLDTDKWYQDTTTAPTFSGGIITVIGESSSYVNGIRGKTTFDTENYICAMKITAAQAFSHLGWADAGIGSDSSNQITFRLAAQKQNVIEKADSAAVANMAWSYNARLEAYRSGGTAYFYEDGSEITHVTDEAHVPTIDLSPGLHSSNTGYTKANWVFVRKYTSIKPLVEVL